MRNRLGRTRRKLAELLQKNFPTTYDGRLAVTWRPEWLYPALGNWRTNKSVDCYRWEGFGKHFDENGIEKFVAFSVGSFYTMSELIQYADLEMNSKGEISPCSPP